MTRTFVHSWHADFAPTQLLPESTYLGRAIYRRASPLRLLSCRCEYPGFARLRRAPWMRLMPLLRLYYCRKCHARVLRLSAGKGTAY